MLRAFILIILGFCNYTVFSMCTRISNLKGNEIIKSEISVRLNKIPDQRGHVYFLLEKENKIVQYNVSEDIFHLCDMNKLFSTFSITEKYNLITPLFRYRKKLNHLLKFKDEIINELFVDLDMQIPQNVTEIDLRLFEGELKKYTYEKVYDKHFLAIILFCGQYAIEKSKNKKEIGWKVKNNIFNPSEKIIYFINHNEDIPITKYVKEYLFRVNRDDDCDDYINTLREIIDLLTLDNIFKI